ncbi:hypothetical protein MLD38_012889 [Melastoma candidum]|uniref:Uncharacterized protein n=1 Tax=Melastoma candidum TaxID=119954 RepID=A0ACB9R927_9MYRT|nr:hypothetical protein MLD38_012889 [Melastoma candidum]
MLISRRGGPLECFTCSYACFASIPSPLCFNHCFPSSEVLEGKQDHCFPHSLSCSTAEDPLGTMTRSMDLESEITHTRHLMGLLEATANNGNGTGNLSRMLSLSLNSPMLGPNQCNDYGQRSFNSEFVNPGYLAVPGVAREACNVNNGGHAFPVPSPLPTTLGNSRYLRPAQSLLEEAVSICDSFGGVPNDSFMQKLCGGRREFARFAAELKAELCSHEAISADKIEIQAKLAKLVSLLEEVEARFDNYYHQMEEVVTSFEAVAGIGAAKSYTALALQAMSKHFCNLRLAIVSQIKTTRRKLFENDTSRIGSGLSRLSLLDQDVRQKRFSLQPLGLIQGQQREAWRPIRGLPETSVVILRAWLFEHFLHPYPNDAEKLMLASQTGLSKNQVSNWFINARVRLWKPMIEEMYKEEFADSLEDSNPLVRSLARDDGGSMADDPDE